MIIISEKSWWPYLRDIDIKSYEFPWLWENVVNKFNIRIWLEETGATAKARGFIAYHFIADSDKKIVINILKLAVHPNQRKMGIGTKLLEHVEGVARLQNISTLIIVLHEENKFIDWVVKRDFIARGIVHELYSDGRDGYGFFKEIK